MKLVIDTDNAAFADDPCAEVARILRSVAKRLDAGATMGSCVDVNGNTVGRWEFWES